MWQGARGSKTVRKDLRITEPQERMLVWLARRLGRTQSDVAREAIVRFYRLVRAEDDKQQRDAQRRSITSISAV